MLPRIIVFALLTTGVWLADAYLHGRLQPEQSRRLAVAAVNGDGGDAARLRLHDSAKDGFAVLAPVLTVAFFVLCFGGPIVRSAREALR